MADIETGESFTIPLPAVGWTSNGNNTFKYKDSSGATRKIVLIKDAKLTKAVCKGTPGSVRPGRGGERGARRSRHRRYESLLHGLQRGARLRR